jgi:hypothetical protein
MFGFGIATYLYAHVRMLWYVYSQVGGPSAPATLAGFSPCIAMTPTAPATCSAYNPITLGKWVREQTLHGQNFNPPGRCWTTCTGRQCNPGGQSAWDYGWTAAWAGGGGQGGARAYATSSLVQDTCAAVIASVYPDLAEQVQWDTPHSCMNA